MPSREAPATSCSPHPIAPARPSQDITQLARAFLEERGLEAAVVIASSSHVAGVADETTANITKKELRDGSVKQFASDMVACSAGSKKWWARHEVLWTDEEKFLAAGAAVVQQLREKVRKKIMRAHVGGAVTAL
jgi:hypothetical protein